MQYFKHNDTVYFHPGYYIREYMESKNYTTWEFAEKIGVNPIRLAYIVNGRFPITRVIAQKLSKEIGTSATMWLRLQDRYNEGVRKTRENGRKRRVR